MSKQTMGLVIGGLVAVTVCVCVTVLLLHGTSDVVTWVTGGLALFAAAVGKPLALWLMKDSDGDGTPDVLQDKADEGTGE